MSHDIPKTEEGEGKPIQLVPQPPEHAADASGVRGDEVTRLDPNSGALKREHFGSMSVDVWKRKNKGGPEK